MRHILYIEWSQSRQTVTQREYETWRAIQFISHNISMSSIPKSATHYLWVSWGRITCEYLSERVSCLLNHSNRISANSWHATFSMHRWYIMHPFFGAISILVMYKYPNSLSYVRWTQNRYHTNAHKRPKHITWTSRASWVMAAHNRSVTPGNAFELLVPILVLQQHQHQPLGLTPMLCTTPNWRNQHFIHVE